MATKKKHPPISVGTMVLTTQPNQPLNKGWTRAALASRQWGVKGEIVAYHDSHGLSYEVRHPDGTIGHYDPTELKKVSK